MHSNKFLNLYVYSDSLAFRRTGQSQDIGFTYPFILKELIEINLGLKTNLVLRGGGGLKIDQILEIVRRDIGYFGGDEQALNIAILQFGIVDCAPQPITYLFAPLLRRLPIIGKAILELFIRHRRRLQNFWSYNVTSKNKFRKYYASIVYACHSTHIKALAMGLPLPTFSIEQRSPWFRRNASIYNELIRNVIPESFCDIEQDMTEALRESILLSDGHHLNEQGHRLYAEKLFGCLKKLI
jgi:lysophospholipase L1-like esterase